MEKYEKDLKHLVDMLHGDMGRIPIGSMPIETLKLLKAKGLIIYHTDLANSSEFFVRLTDKGVSLPSERKEQIHNVWRERFIGFVFGLLTGLFVGVLVPIILKVGQ